MSVIRFLESKGPWEILIISIDSGNTYKLRWNKEKSDWYCSCPAYIFRGKSCKHLRAFKAGEIDAPPEIEKVDEFAD